MNLEAYRLSAEEFLSQLDRAYYRHYAGLEDEYELEPIYERHAELFERAAVETLRALAAGAPSGSDERRRMRMLLDFAVEGHLGIVTKRLDAELAGREARLSVEVDGERYGFRAASVVQANEPDPDRRASIEHAALAALEHELTPLHRERLELIRATARELGYEHYRALCEECKELDLGALHAQTEAFQAATRASYPAVLEPDLARTPVPGFEALRRSDLPYLSRAPELDGMFTSERLLTSFIDTMEGLGIDIASQRGLVLDLESRPNKSPRAFCAPVRKPGEVYLVLAPIGGFDDYETLFHEGGHAQHAANANPALAFEFRQLGDNAISEAYAFLFQYLIGDPEWLRRRLGVTDPGPVLAHERAQRLLYLRRYAGKLSYELELHSDGPAAAGALADRYAQLLSDALQIPWPREPFLADVDDGFYCAAYLRAWAFEVRLRAHLRDRFGGAWFEQPAAGEVLAGLWRIDERLSAEELLGELTGEALDFAALADEFAR
jgi:hypothetical protein